MIYFFQYLVFFYATAVAFVYLALIAFSYINTIRYRSRYTKNEESFLKEYPEEAPGISIVAPAYNEDIIVIDSVHALLNLDYPNFEVIIVNDGSVDATLDLLKNEFSLQETPYFYVQKVFCQAVKRIYTSSDPKYNKLIVVDKVNGGTKADAMNAGVNIAQYDYFINTDIDCILANDTLTKIILPVLGSDVEVIAVGGTMRMTNGCIIEKGEIKRVSPPKSIIPLFQEIEYLRSYLVAKMGWSYLNALPNVSGGFGLFKKSVVIHAGGFDSGSHAEDMDITLRMVAYMRDNQKPYRIVQCPHTCCWTEGPPNINVLYRQRTRWGRGLLQFIVNHRKYLFNKDYGRLGFVVMPYVVFFEFLAPIVEFVGFIFLVFLLLTGQVNFETFWITLLYVYLIGVFVSTLTISYDLMLKKWYKSFGEYLKLVIFSTFEAILYHPLVVFFTLRGYLQYLTMKEFKWGKMTRKGFSSTTNKEEVSHGV